MANNTRGFSQVYFTRKAWKFLRSWTLTSCRQEASSRPHSLKITVTDTHKFVSKVEPKELALGADESGTVRVDLTVLAGTAAGVGEDVVIVAASTGGPSTSNSSVVHFSVSSSSASQNPR